MLKKIAFFFTAVLLSIFIYFQFFFDFSVFINKHIKEFSKANPYIEISKPSSVDLQLIPIGLKIPKVTLKAKDASVAVKIIDVENFTLDIPFNVLKSFVFPSSNITKPLKAMDDLKANANIAFEFQKQKIKMEIGLLCKKNITILKLKSLKESSLNIQANISMPYGLNDWTSLNFLDKNLSINFHHLIYDVHQLKANVSLDLNQKMADIQNIYITSRLDGFKPIAINGHIKVNFKNTIPDLTGHIHCYEVSKVSVPSSHHESTTSLNTKNKNFKSTVVLPIGMIQGKLDISIEKLDLKLENLRYPLTKLKGIFFLSPQELRFESFKAFVGKDQIQAYLKSNLTKTDIQLSLRKFDLTKNFRIQDVPLKKGYLTSSMNISLSTNELLNWNEKSIQQIQGSGSIEIEDGVVTLFDLTQFLKHLRGIKNLDDLLKTTELLDKKRDTSLSECQGAWNLKEGYQFNFKDLKAKIDAHQLKGRGSYNGNSDQINFSINVQPHSTYKIPSFSLLITQTLSNPKFSVNTDELAQKIIRNAAKNIVQKHLKKLILGSDAPNKQSSKTKEPSVEKAIKNIISDILPF